MTDCTHDWIVVGVCRHYHTTGFNDHRLSQCQQCAAYGHGSRPVGFGCGRRRSPVPPPLCPVDGDAAAWAKWHAPYQARRADVEAAVAARRAARQRARESEA